MSEFKETSTEPVVSSTKGRISAGSNLPPTETATGRILGVIPIEGTAYVRIDYVDAKGGAIPQKYMGKYTGYRPAYDAIRAFVLETFEVAAEHTKKRR